MSDHELKLMPPEEGYEPVEVDVPYERKYVRLARLDEALARAERAEAERDRFYGLWELEATRAVRAEGDNFLHAWDLAKVKVERDALRAALASIRDDNVSSDLWLRQKANDALLAPHPPTNG